MVKNSSWHHNLKRERQLRGWSQADVADRIGSDPKTVGRWERGLAFPGPYFQQRLLDLFGKDAVALGFIAGQGENLNNTPVDSNSLHSHRDWGEALHIDNDTEGSLTVVWPPNLPVEPYYPLPGRERALHHLLTILQDSQGALVITVDGLGGLGKTALAVEFTRRALHQGLFKSVIGDSAKQKLFERTDTGRCTLLLAQGPVCAILKQRTKEGTRTCTLLIFVLTMNQPSARLRRCWWRALLPTGQKRGQTWKLL